MKKEDINELIEDITATKPIKLHIKGIRDNAPRAVGYYNSKKLFVPDIVSVYADKRNLYAIEKHITKKDLPILTFKWILFSAEARKTAGKFYLVIDKSKELMCKKLIKDKKLEIELMIL